jgi:hypothetical protein
VQERKRRRLEQERERLAQRLAGLGHLIRGTLVRTGKTCGSQGCHCHRGRLHPHTVISTHRDGRSRLVYVRQGREGEARAAVAAYREAWRVIEKLSRLNEELFRDAPQSRGPQA